jgi:hypothetical protein
LGIAIGRCGGERGPFRDKEDNRDIFDFIEFCFVTGADLSLDGSGGGGGGGGGIP